VTGEREREKMSAYEVLEMESMDVPIEAIRKSYLRLARKYHPDKDKTSTKV